MESFEIKGKIKFGKNALSYLSNLMNKNIFIVTDPFLVKSGAIEKITTYLSNSKYHIFSDILPDPPIELVAKGILELGKVDAQIIIAIGGGSAIDLGKAIWNFSKKINSNKELEFYAIPTTSGTGTEVTSFAVITDPEKEVKYPLVSNDLIPDVAILDPELVKTVPPPIVADTGMDVLTHAFEAYVSKKANDFSDALAEKAIVYVFKYLVRSFKDSNDLEAKEKMHNASCLAGVAFNSASLGLNHGIAHALGGKFHIPHGRANAILLPHIIAFNSGLNETGPLQQCTDKYAYLAKLIGITSGNNKMAVKNLVNEIKKLQRDMKMPTKITECKVDINELEQERKEIVQMSLKDICTVTNPRSVSEKDVIQILDQLI